MKNTQVSNIIPQSDHCTQIKNVLIVEDSLLLLNHISQSLSDILHLSCDTAETEKEAIALLQSKSYDLVITDIYLPDSSGNFIGKLIRQKNRIIIITGNSNEESREKLVSLPIVDYLYKTDEKTVISYLVNCIRRLNENAKTVVAVCDDSKLSRLRVIQILAQQNLGYLEFVDGKEAHDYLLHNGLKFDLLITDVNMPRMNGLDLVRYIRHVYTSNELPILVLSASEKISSIAQLLKTGANDYTSKPISSEEFWIRLNAMLDQSRLYRENQILIEKLRMAATTDFLTKLYNRNFFYSSIKQVQAQARREACKYGIILLDIDHFKRVNDNYGHEAGDIALKRVSNIIKNTLRESDIACRWGGEEFLILSPKSTLTEVVTLAERLRKRIESSSIIINPEILEFNITASFGVAVDNDENIERVIAKADEYLYKVKESGRNAVGFK